MAKDKKPTPFATSESIDDAILQKGDTYRPNADKAWPSFGNKLNAASPTP